MKTTPIGALMAEASITPAVVLLNHRQRRFTDRIASLPKDRMAKQMLQLGSTKNNEDTSDLEYRPLKTLKDK
jgi:hypothetical protein